MVEKVKQIGFPGVSSELGESAGGAAANIIPQVFPCRRPPRPREEPHTEMPAAECGVQGEHWRGVG